ncbi:MAG: hypothetical protein IJR95_03350 [Lachnospiraceae bacterium]|nr:hypothetical protein [Lachnospiraceae bacterium]
MGYGGIVFSKGYVQVRFIDVDNDGNTIAFTRVYSLESSGDMAKWDEKADQIMAYDGTEIIVNGLSQHQKKDNTGIPIFAGLYGWDPEASVFRYIGERPTDYGSGWYGAKEGYAFCNGFLCRWDYATEKFEPLFDTDLEGKKDLYVFSEGLLLTDMFFDYYDQDAEISNTIHFNFYDWEFKLTGKCELSIEGKHLIGGIVFSETADRILFTLASFANYPTHYINKADLGTGEIKMHEYYYPDLNLPE